MGLLGGGGKKSVCSHVKGRRGAVTILPEGDPIIIVKKEGILSQNALSIGEPFNGKNSESIEGGG